MLTIIGLDRRDDQKDQVKDVYRRQQNKANAREAKKPCAERIHQYRDLEVHRLFALLVCEWEIVFLYLPDNQRCDDAANDWYYRQQATESRQMTEHGPHTSIPIDLLLWGTCGLPGTATLLCAGITAGILLGFILGAF
jgi:hypothetical protein